MNMKVATDTPTIFVIFGITGDLAKRKLVPALFHLFSAGLLPAKFDIIGFSRREITPTDFRTHIAGIIEGKGTDEQRSAFLDRISYQQGFFDDVESYRRLGLAFSVLERSYGVCANKLFHLSVPPDLYRLILDKVSESGLSIPCSDSEGWTRILIEKPFGKDLKSAQALDQHLSELFDERQIFRIDHYLAKEAIQNILSFRFSNPIIRSLWSQKSIASIDITLHEKLDVAERGAFYDGVGALRDVGQNHILAMLSLLAMEEPKDLNAESVRALRAKALKSLRPLKSASSMSGKVFRGQYAGFTAEQGVAADSRTETFFRIESEPRRGPLKGVPIALEAGKALKDAKVSIVVRFKRLGESAFVTGDETIDNKLEIDIQPKEAVRLSLWFKAPGLSQDVVERTLSVGIEKDPLEVKLPDAYERVLFDAVAGDQTLFASTEEVLASWRYITPILTAWDALPLHIYEKGSAGPDVTELKKRYEKR